MRTGTSCLLMGVVWHVSIRIYIIKGTLMAVV